MTSANERNARQFVAEVSGIALAVVGVVENGIDVMARGSQDPHVSQRGREIGRPQFPRAFRRPDPRATESLTSGRHILYIQFVLKAPIWQN